jgi:hypothetical protein
MLVVDDMLYRYNPFYKENENDYKDENPNDSLQNETLLRK